MLLLRNDWLSWYLMSQWLAEWFNNTVTPLSFIKLLCRACYSGGFFFYALRTGPEKSQKLVKI